MRKLNVGHWADIESLEGLLFFSELIDEMLFDYTLDSYKPLALNSRLLCVECISTIHEIKNGFMNQKNLPPVVEELKWSLNSDLAAKLLLGAKFDFYIDKLNQNANNNESLVTIVSFFYNLFNEKKYLDQVKALLRQLVKSGKEKAKIRSLTGTLLTELINYGYHPNHIYYQNRNFFFNPLKKATISDASSIDEFFDFFNFEEKEFTVVFIGDIIFREFKDTLNSFDIVVTSVTSR